MKAALVFLLAVGLVAFAAPLATAHTGEVKCVDDPVCYALCLADMAEETVKRQPTHVCRHYQSHLA